MRLSNVLRNGAFVLLASIVSSTAQAQMNAPWVTISQINMNAAWGMQSASLMKQQARGSARHSGGGATSSTYSSASSQNLTLAWSPVVSAQARQEFLDNMAKSSGRPVAEEADRHLGNIRTTFAQMVAPYGLRSDNFGDVFAAYIIVMWMAANGETQLPSVSQVQAVRGQMNGFFAATLDSAGDDSHKQMLAETAMYMTCMAVTIREQAQLQNKPELLDSMAGAVNQAMIEQGQRLRTITLTDRGFIKR